MGTDGKALGRGRGSENDSGNGLVSVSGGTVRNSTCQNTLTGSEKRQGTVRQYSTLNQRY